MNILVLGDDPKNSEFVTHLEKDGRHRILMSCPPLAGYPGVTDLEAALATADIQAVLIGGAVDQRGEWLRRCAGQGWICLCQNPPGINTDPYYQVALSNHEFRSVIVPDLPLRFHPGIEAVREAVSAAGSAGPIRSIVIETEFAGRTENLAYEPFALWADVIRYLIGDIENIAAMGFPAGLQPTERFTAQLRAAGDRRCELTIRTGTGRNFAKMTVTATHQTLVLEFDPDSTDAGQLTKTPVGQTASSGAEPLTVEKHSLGQWDQFTSMIRAWENAFENRDAQPNPGLLDGTRSMEVAEGAIRSLRRGRAIDLYYEEVSEANNFKTVMTSVGCMMVVGILMALPLILAGPALGLPFTLYLGYLIPLVLAGFALLQLLRLIIR